MSELCGAVGGVGVRGTGVGEVGAREGDAEERVSLDKIITLVFSQRLYGVVMYFCALDARDMSRAHFIEARFTYGGAGCGSGSGLLGGREDVCVYSRSCCEVSGLEKMKESGVERQEGNNTRLVSDKGRHTYNGDDVSGCG